MSPEQSLRLYCTSTNQCTNHQWVAPAGQRQQQQACWLQLFTSLQDTALRSCDQCPVHTKVTISSMVCCLASSSGASCSCHSSCHPIKTGLQQGNSSSGRRVGHGSVGLLMQQDTALTSAGPCMASAGKRQQQQGPWRQSCRATAATRTQRWPWRQQQRSAIWSSKLQLPWCRASATPCSAIPQVSTPDQRTALLLAFCHVHAQIAHACLKLALILMLAHLETGKSPGKQTRVYVNCLYCALWSLTLMHVTCWAQDEGGPSVCNTILDALDGQLSISPQSQRQI